MRRLPAAVSERFASERYPALQGYGPDAAGNHGGYPPAVATCPVPSAAGFVLPALQPVVPGYSVPAAGSRRFAGGVRSDNHRRHRPATNRVEPENRVAYRRLSVRASLCRVVRSGGFVLLSAAR